MHPTKIIISGLIIFLVYWVSYYYSRKKIGGSRMGNFVFLINIVMLVLASTYMLAVFDYLGILNIVTRILILLMFLSGLIHHITLFIIGNHHTGKTVRLIHGPLTHISFFVLFTVNVGIFGINMTKLIPVNTQFILAVFLLITLTSVPFGVNEGLKWRSYEN